jgi:hypothetical protein
LRPNIASCLTLADNQAQRKDVRMSDENPKARALPAQPSLEHLRKESKRLLQELRGRSRTARLADAQLLLARTYGYPSWRALKLEVDQRLALVVPLPPRPLGYHRVVLAGSWDTTMAEGLFYLAIVTGAAFCQFAAAITRNIGV